MASGFKWQGIPNLYFLCELLTLVTMFLPISSGRPEPKGATKNHFLVEPLPARRTVNTQSFVDWTFGERVLVV